MYVGNSKKKKQLKFLSKIQAAYLSLLPFTPVNISVLFLLVYLQDVSSAVMTIRKRNPWLGQVQYYLNQASCLHCE